MKMTESMKSEVVRLYFEENREEAEIAARLGISLRQSKTVLGDLARLETYKKRSEAAKLRAQICVNIKVPRWQPSRKSPHRQSPIRHAGFHASVLCLL